MKIRPLDQTIKVFYKDTHFNGLFRYNQLSEDIEFVRPPEWDSDVFEGKRLDDDDLSEIRYYLTNIHQIEPSKQIVGEACLLNAKMNQYHPVKNFIEKEKWDNIPRLDTWLIKATSCEDNVYTRHAGAKFLIAAVNRVYHPGCKFDHMMILEGDQGIGKSTLVEELAGDWYLDTNFDNKDKDLVDAMRGAFIIEISELSGMNKKDIDWLKSFLTKKIDRVRLAYAARSKDFLRKSVFIGTYNPSGNNNYFRDDTGNRRFWPIECKKIDVNYVRINKQQLWAEAFHRFNNKEKYYIDDPEALKILKRLHEDREVEGPIFLKIRRWLDNSNVDEIGIDEIMERCLQITDRSPKEMHSTWTIIGMIMRKLGWRKGTNLNRHKYYKNDIITTKWEE